MAAKNVLLLSCGGVSARISRGAGDTCTLDITSPDKAAVTIKAPLAFIVTVLRNMWHTPERSSAPTVTATTDDASINGEMSASVFEAMLPALIQMLPSAKPEVASRLRNRANIRVPQRLIDEAGRRRERSPEPMARKAVRVESDSDSFSAEVLSDSDDDSPEAVVRQHIDNMRGQNMDEFEAFTRVMAQPLPADWQAAGPPALVRVATATAHLAKSIAASGVWPPDLLKQLATATQVTIGGIDQHRAPCDICSRYRTISQSITMSGPDNVRVIAKVGRHCAARVQLYWHLLHFVTYAHQKMAKIVDEDERAERLRMLWAQRASLMYEAASYATGESTHFSDDA